MPRITVRLSDEENKALVADAARQGRSIGGVVRQRLSEIWSPLLKEVTLEYRKRDKGSIPDTGRVSDNRAMANGAHSAPRKKGRKSRIDTDGCVVRVGRPRQANGRAERRRPRGKRSLAK